MSNGSFNKLTVPALLIFFFSSCSYFTSNKLINGSVAPIISVPDSNGQIISLYSLKGKLVLLNFWASWCKPCREENPKMVSLYEKYKGASFQNATGFTIMSVSLDSEKDKWLKAINDDNLHWENHACDLNGWKSEAIDSYQVSSIPASFLVDQNGVVIGKDLKMRDLDKLLAMLISK